MALSAAPLQGRWLDGPWRGHALFLCAALLWALYTVAFRRSGLGAWQATALINLWSVPPVVLVWLCSPEARLLAVPWAMAAQQAIWQGLIAGLAGMGAYALAVRHLGASKAALSGAMVPPGAALAGWLFLDEAVDLPTALAVGLTTLGVALASGAVRIRRAAN